MATAECWRREKFIDVFKERVFNVYSQTWHGNLKESHKATYYAQFKIDLSSFIIFRIEINPRHRNALIKLRTLKSNLRIESGSWCKPKIPQNERFCLICNSCNLIEDEYHFVLICKAYKTCREKYIPFYFYNNPNNFKFIELMITKNGLLLRILSSFLYNAFRIRADYLEI